MRAISAVVIGRSWIPKGRQTVKKVVGKCLKYRRHEGKAFVGPETPS